ncbi:MAG: ABC transporter permease [Ilumatobacteraceae bacterium]
MDRPGPALTRNRLPPRLIVALAAVPVLFLVVFYLWPFATLLARGLTPGTVRDTFTRASTWDIAWFTLWQALASTALTVAAGLLPAYVLARFRFPGRRLLAGLLAAAFVLPTVVMGAAILALLPAGWERGVPAILAAHVTFNLAVVVRTVGAVWQHLPPDLEAAAATLGASPWRTWWAVTMPLLRPAILAAAAIVFVFTFTSFGIVRVLGDAGTSTIEVEVWRRATQLGDIGAAATLAVTQLILIGVLVGWSSWQQRRHSRALDLRPLARRVRPRRGRQRALVAVTAVATAGVVVAPLIALVLRSVRNRAGWSLAAWQRLGDAEVRPGVRLGVDPLSAIVNSLRTAALATVFAVTIGALAALAITASRRLGRLLDAGLMLPIATSAVTIGFGILITFDQPPVDWRASPLIVPIGQALVAVPFVVRIALPVLRGVDPRLHEAASTLGASPTRAWREVTLAHLRRPLLLAAGLAAAISLGEFGATSFLSRQDSETMPIVIARLLGRTGDVVQAQAYVLATILAVVTVLVVVALDLAGDRELPTMMDASARHP